MVTIAFGAHVILAALLLNLSVWYHFLYRTQDPRVVEAFDRGQANFGVLGYVESVGLAELFPCSDPHTWLIFSLSVVMVAAAMWTVLSAVVKMTKC